MPSFNDGETEWDDMIWADEGGVMLLARKLDNGSVQLRISGREQATATIAQFRLARIAALIAEGIEREQKLYEPSGGSGAPEDGS